MGNGRRDTLLGRGKRPRSGAGQTRSGRGDELQCQDAWDVRVRFVGKSDIERRQGSDHDDVDGSSEEGR